MTVNDPHAESTDSSESIYRAPTSDTSVPPQSEDLFDAFLGRKNTAYYRQYFAKFAAGKGDISWNWPAFFISSIWLLYRKMWAFALLYWFALPIVLSFLSAIIAGSGNAEGSVLFYYGSYFVVGFVILPMFANRLYYRHANKKIARIVSAISNEEQRRLEAARVGGTSNIVVVAVPVILVFVIGILAAIAIPAYQDYTIRAQVAEGLNLAAGARAAVTEYYLDSGAAPPDNASAGIDEAGRIAGNYVESVEVADGEIIVTYGNQANVLIQGKTLHLYPEAGSAGLVQWNCRSFDIMNKHLPAACRPSTQ